MTEAQRVAAFVAPPMWKMRLAFHPSLKMSLHDLRDITLRETIEFHTMLDVADETAASKLAEAERKSRLNR